MVWSGKYVAEQLDITFKTEEQPIRLEQLVGLALRENPKRAHLLVSNVLGKHVPISPNLLIAAAQALAIIVDEKLEGKNFSNSHRILEELSQILEGKVNFSDIKKLLSNSKITSQSVVLGYAETATALGAIVAEKLGSYYISSTRYPVKHAVNYGVFEEEHSHATSHNVAPKNTSYLDSKLPLVLVDDELTTGKTIMNTIASLQQQNPRSKYVVATLVDLRKQDSRQIMKKFAEELGITIEVAALTTGEVSLGKNSVKIAQNIIKRDKHLSVVHETNNFATELVVLNEEKDFILNAELTKSGVKNFAAYSGLATQAAKDVNKVIFEKNVLVLGIEEEMYLPILFAEHLATLRENIFFSTTTRSPVFPMDSDEYAIRNKIEYVIPERDNDTNVRYAYNISEGFDTAILIVNNNEHFYELENLIQQLQGKVKKIVMVKYHTLPEPLTGPTFGSYDKNDVKWLLKDLSNIKLEIVTEDREEAIQGGAHYAESLPVEYQPTEEYQKLFKDSLQEVGSRIATAVGVVSEQIVNKRKSPVLVSLARAGTPVGILIKRYIAYKYRVNLPHYAISIVRGKGIDVNALRYLAHNYHPEDIIFIDGWTGKGAITKELSAALTKYGEETGEWFNPEVAVLADPGSCVEIFGTREDYLIPSACLNSTVSGLISRTVLNDSFIGENDYHGAKFYKEFAENDYSNYFIDEIVQYFPLVKKEINDELNEILSSDVTPTWAGWASIEDINIAYGINNINLVKPGVGETTRVLLRRVPWKILIRRDQWDNLKHIIVLAKERGTELEIVDNLPYSCVGLIHPQYTKGATGFDGVSTV